ncbi:MAG TPA: TIGR00725 family protein [Chryseosolibacter sp.]
MKKPIVGIMGPGESARPEENEMAFALGKAIARQGWIVLTGGRSFGIMESAMKGAHEANGLTIGILPTEDALNASDDADIKILTGMGSGRNIINVLSSHILVVIGMAAGTASEVALAIKANKKIILLHQDEVTIRFFKNIGTYKVLVANTIEETLKIIKEYIRMTPSPSRSLKEDDSSL